MKFSLSLAVFFLLSFTLTAADDPDELKRATVLDFETALNINKWPEDKPGEIKTTDEWQTEGAKSLKIDAGLMAAITELKLKNWNDYSLLRFRFKNTTDQTVIVGFELQDENTTFHDRHQNGFGVPPGEHTIELFFTGGLWRGEENKPYRKLKTPINIGNITRMSFTNTGNGPIYLDQVEVIKLKTLSVPGGFAFDFGKAGTQLMFNFQRVSETSEYDAAKGFGLLGGRAGTIGKSMSFPTPLLGDGVAWPEGFRVDLPEGGKYLGWIAFERGGFWETEQCGYSKCTLTVNGTKAHEHDFAPAGPHFLFQDTEITDMSQLAEKLIWPAHAISRFSFDAQKGANTFKLDIQNPTGFGLRVAGLILAPDTAEGKAFLEAHEALQRKVIATTFAAQDRGRRGEGRAEPAKNLVCQAMNPGEMVYPRDWPLAKESRLDEILAVTGQTVTVQLGVYGKKDLKLAVAASEARGPGVLSAPAISHGRYLPQRPYGVGAVWLEIHHYRPESTFTVSPNVARSVLVEYSVPVDAKPGVYTSSIKISGDGESFELPVSIRVSDVKLADIPIPVGLFMNSLPLNIGSMDEKKWWSLQESLLKEQSLAGLNTVTGGPSLDLKLEGGNIAGDIAIKYLKLAKNYNMTKAIVPYGGFLPGTRAMKDHAKAWADAIQKFEAEHGFGPLYVKGYDEPGTPDEKKGVLAHLKPCTDGGVRTIGYTSAHWGDALWEELLAASHTPAFNLHDPSMFEKVKKLGRHPWTYNNGDNRYGYGIHLWRQITLGCEGRLDWIGNFTQGFAFHNLDGREPSYGMFMVHSEYGVLKTTRWVSGREGLLDLRLRLTLEKTAPKDDAALKLWDMGSYRKDDAKWTDEELEKVRRAMLKRIEELSKK
ncbi:MAG TPA: hypothetical protein VEJ63_20995 [Planctomycetota bacterium]|nr:hypothetical protein [Planctomycetota bacterium]